MTMRVSDEAIRDALRPGPGVAAPDHFVSSVMSTIATDAASEAVARGRARPRTGVTMWRPSSRWSFLLLTLLLLLAVGAALVIGSRLVAPTPRPVLPPGVFEPTGQIPNASDLQRPAVATLADGRVLIAGGNTDDARTALLFDPVSETYGDPIRMRASRWDATATTLRDGMVLVVGGMDPTTVGVLANAESFDPTSGTFTTVEPMTVARANHTATLLDDGRVLIAGGQQYRESEPGSQSFVGQAIASAELYDPTTDTFTPLGDMTSERVEHTATLLSDGTVLIVGGYGRGEAGAYVPTTSAEIFDPTTTTFRSVGELSTARAGHSATRLPDGRLLIAGGGTVFDADGYATLVTPTAEIYDPTTESFAPTGSLRTERTKHSATLLPDGRVLLAGGWNAFGLPWTAELFDQETDTFHEAGTASSEHRFGIAPLLPDGRVFFPESWASEIFDPEGGPALGATAPSLPARESGSPATESRSTATPTPAFGAFRSIATTIRSGHTAVVLEDGRVLIAGGYGGPEQSELSTAEVFDPDTDTFAPTGSMAVARLLAVATRLPDGRILIAGGDPTDAKTAEVYDPASGTFGPAMPEIDALLEIGEVVPVQGLADGVLALLRYVEAEGTEPSKVLILVDTDGHEIASANLCGSFHFWGTPAAMLRDGRILILCGPDEPAHVFDPATGATSSAGIRGDWVTATALADGRVVLASARRDRAGDLSAILAVTGLYDPVTGTLEALTTDRSTPMSGRRRNEQYGSMTELSNGAVLLAGGFWGARDSVWLVDPATGTTHDVGPMLAAREQPSVTGLEDGRALIVGGVTQSPDRSDPVPPAAELFDPRLSP